MNFAWHFAMTHPSVSGVPSKVSSAAETAAQYYDVPAPLLMAVAKVESRFNAHAVSPCGADGVMQIMPATARLLHVRDVFSVEDSMFGAAKYIVRMTMQYGGVKQALFAYNTGHAGTAWQVSHSPYVQSVWKDYVRIKDRLHYI